MPDTNPREDLDAEGVPPTEERAPGMDIELDQESEMAPRDQPLAAGGGSGYPVTEAEQRRGEGVAERAARETPGVGAATRPPAADEQPVGELDEVDEAEDAGGEAAGVVGAAGNVVTPGALSEAVDVDDPLPPEDDEREVADRVAVRPVDPFGEGLDADHEPEAVSEDLGPHDGDATAEEVAMHLEEDR